MSAGRATDALFDMWRDHFDGFSISLCIGRHAGDFNAVGESIEFARGPAFPEVEDTSCASRFLRVVDVGTLDDEAICVLAAKAFETPAPPDGWPMSEPADESVLADMAPALALMRFDPLDYVVTPRSSFAAYFEESPEEWRNKSLSVHSRGGPVDTRRLS